MAVRDVVVRLRAEIGDYTGKMSQAAAATDKVASSAEKAGKAHSGSARSILANAAAGAAAAKVAGTVTATAKGMVQAYMDFDAQMSSVGAATNASATDLGKLRKAAMDAGAEFGQFTATEAAQGLEELGKAGLTTDQSIGALRGTMALAATEGMNVGRSAELTADAMNMFGLNSKKGMQTYAAEGGAAVAVANRLAQGAGAASGSAEQLGQGLSQVGAVANQMGVSMDDTVQTLALFAKNGIKGSDAGTSLKTMFMSLANPSKEAAAQMKALGIEAFDAQGKFVGMRDLTDQLSKSLAGKSAEERNAALATMFGSDAMRVAGVLTKEGAAGYDKMGRSMKDFGDATSIAAKRNDNLSGKFKNLGGAWENLSIKMGAGADGPLSKAVDGLTSLLELAGRHTTATQWIAGTAAGLVALGGAAVAVAKTVSTVRELGAALSLLKGGASASNVAAGLEGVASKGGGIRGTASALGKLAGPTVAFGIALGGIEIARHFNGQNTAAIDATRTSIEQMNGAMTAAQSGSTSYAAAVDSAFKGTTAGLDGVAGSLDAVKASADAGILGKAGEWATGLVGMQSAAGASAAQFDKLDQSLSSVSFAQAAVSMQEVSRQNASIGMSTEKLVGLFPTYSAKLKEQAAAMGVTNLSAQEMEAWMGGRLPASVQKAAQAAVASKGANAGMAKSILDNAAAAQKLTAQVAQMPSQKKLDLIVNAASSAKDVHSFQEAIKALPPAVRTQLDAVLKRDGLDAAKAELRQIQGRHQIDLIVKAANAQTTISGFVASLKGLPKETVAHLKTVAQTQGLTAAKKELASVKDKSVTLATKGNTSGAKAVQGAVAATKGKTVDVKSTGNTSGAKAVQGAVSATTGKTVAVNTRADLSGAHAAQGAVAAVPSSKTSTITTIFRTIKEKLGFATGGYVSGPGTGTSDSIDAKLSNGEFVMRAAAVRRLGLARLDHMNETGAMPAFATGGRIYGPGSTTSDDVPAWLSRDEYVVRAASASRLGYGVLDYINRTGQLPRGFANGGRIGGTFSGQVSRYISSNHSVQQSTTFSPTFEVHGPNAEQVVASAVARFRHEARAMAIATPGN